MKSPLDDDDEGKHKRIDAGEVIVAHTKPVSPSDVKPLVKDTFADPHFAFCHDPN